MSEKNVGKEMAERKKELDALENREDMLKRNIAELEIDKHKPRDYNSMKLAVEKIKNLEILENELKKVKEQRARLDKETWLRIPEYNRRIREEGEKTKKKSRFSFLRRKIRKRP